MNKPDAPEAPKPSDSGASDSAVKPAPDVALVHGVTEDGQGLRVLRQRAGRLESGAVKPLREGVPITGEVVKLTPRPEFPLLCDVETQLPAASTETQAASGQHAQRKGPAQVATDQYRRNWDAIYKKPELLN